MKKKAQAAMEFLMTYGWAILVVLVVIGALAYFGVLSPKKLLPDKCLFGAGVGSCTDFQAASSDGDITLVLSNGLGETITIAGYTFGATTSCTAASGLAMTVPAGAQVTLDVVCAYDVAGEKTNEEMNIIYYRGTTASGLSHSISGQIGITVQ